MKRYVELSLIFIFIIPAGYRAVSAMDYLLGVRGGYFIWDPFIKEVNSQFNQMETGSGALYGPVASMILTEDLSLSFSGLFGRQSGAGLSEGVPRNSGQYQDIKYSFDTSRNDIDGALSYRLGENVKVFAGYKYWYLKTEYKTINYWYNGTTHTLTQARHEEMTIKQPFHGPAGGVGFSLPLGEKGYFVAANLSGLYMWGKFKFESEPPITYDYTYRVESAHSGNFDMKMYGVNVEPTIGLNPGEGLPIFTLGVRYQYNRMKVLDGDSMELNPDWVSDKIYGLFIGILYQI